MQAYLVHRTATRLRFRVQVLHRKAGLAEDLADRIAGVEGVSRVLVRPGTGSVIVECDAADAVFERLTGSGPLRLRRPPKPVPVGVQARFAVALVDRAIARSSEGQWDLRSAAVALLTVAALYQLVRGNLFGPVTTLSLNALSLLGSLDGGAGEGGSDGDGGA